jgi:hypothetical protein
LRAQSALIAASSSPSLLGESHEKECARMNKRASRALAIAKGKYVHPSDEPRQRFLTAITNSDLQAVLALSQIGVLLTLNVILRFPDLGALIAQSNQF